MDEQHDGTFAFCLSQLRAFGCFVRSVGRVRWEECSSALNPNRNIHEYNLCVRHCGNYNAAEVNCWNIWNLFTVPDYVRNEDGRVDKDGERIVEDADHERLIGDLHWYLEVPQDPP